MISKEKEAQILRLSDVEGWSPGTIASQLGVHHDVVDRVTEQQGATRVFKQRPKLVDPYVGFIASKLKEFPGLPASRLYEMVKQRGYSGRPDHFRTIIATMRPPKPAEAFLRLRTLPGEQAQVDWAHCGRMLVCGTLRPLMAFVMVLSFSRYVFLRFFLDAAMGSFLQGHVEGFTAFGGVPRTILYDNLKSAVLERVGEAIRFHPTLLELSSHYRFEPKPVAVARGNEKGRVERAIRFIRTSFLPARTYQDLDDINAQAQEWMQGTSAQRRCPEDRTMTVQEAFESERPRLLACPGDPFACEDRKVVGVGKTPYVRFDRNDYSVPAKYVRRSLVVLATRERVRILDGSQLVAVHERCWAKSQQIENPEHIKELAERKRAARRERSMDRLHHALPSCATFFERIAERGGNLGATTVGLTRLLDAYGAAELEIALSEALAAERVHLGALRHILDRRRKQQNLPPPAVQWPASDDPRKQPQSPRVHALSDYDRIARIVSEDSNVSHD